MRCRLLLCLFVSGSLAGSFGCSAGSTPSRNGNGSGTPACNKVREEADRDADGKADEVSTWKYECP